MDLEFTDDQLELQQNARAVLASACPPSLVRSVYEDGGTADALWKRLVELYWPGLAIDEEHGGLGLTFVETALVVEELGRAVAPGPFLATVTQLAPILRESASTRHLRELLPRVAAGTITGTLAIAESAGSWDPAAVRAAARPAGSGWVLAGTKSYVVDGATAEEIAVVARAQGSTGLDGLGVFLVPGNAITATSRTVIDPTIALADISLDGVEVAADRVLLEPGDPAAAPAITRALEEATVAIAISTIGTCRVIFETTLQYAKDREQFGRPIGSFQAIKHRLAEMYMAVERATALAYFAALTIAEDDERRALAAAMAKAAAGDCERLLAQDGLQLHGGIGYTWEHDLHFLLKRAKSGGALFGTAAAQRAAIARMLHLAA